MNYIVLFAIANTPTPKDQDYVTQKCKYDTCACIVHVHV